MSNDQQRMRVTFTKGENLRYISHLDLSRTWERALRRAGIPVAYSQGYHPHPRMVFASALPVGCTGEAEVLDIFLSQPMPPRRMLRGLAAHMPEGLRASEATPVYYRAPALPTLLHGADYDSVILTDQPMQDAARRCSELLAQDAIPRKRRGKAYDLRPLIDDLEVSRVNASQLLVRMQLAAGDRGTGRPDEVLDALGWGAKPHRCHRRRLRLAALEGETDKPSVQN